MDFRLKNLPELLKTHTGPNKIIKNSKLTRLTPPGENFASLILKLDVTLENKEDSSEEILHGVAKVFPDNELAKKMFPIPTFFRNEIGWYETVVPTLQMFQRELGIKEVIDSFPKLIGNRNNLKGGDEIDDDAVLILENLKESGYRNIDRTKGFDLETTKMILDDLALFHALPLALRIKHPKIFQEKIKTYFHELIPPVLEVFNDIIKDLVSQKEELAHLASKITFWGKIKRSEPREPFATIIHTDLWMNNTMQKFQDGRPVSNKFVDFQMYSYGSPVTDVFFFLWSSVSLEVLESHLDFLLEYYHKHFVDLLKKHQVDVTPFSYENFLKELELEAEYEFGHAIHFSLVTTGETKDIDLENFNSQDFVDKLSQRTKDRIWYMVKECARRGWLK